MRLSKSFREDIKWWSEFSAWFKGQARIISACWEDQVSLEAGASNTGYGAVYGRDWCAVAWDSECTVDGDIHGHWSSSILEYTEYAGLQITAKSAVALRTCKTQMLVLNCTGAYGTKAVSRPSLMNVTS